MGGTQKSFRFWVSYWDVAQELPPKQRGEFYTAIVDYMFTDDDPEDMLKGQVKLAFKAIKANLNTSKIRSKSGVAGNKVRWSSDDITESQTYRKPIAKASQIKTQIKSKTKSQIQSEDELNNPEPPGVTKMPQEARDNLHQLWGVRA